MSRPPRCSHRAAYLLLRRQTKTGRLLGPACRDTMSSGHKEAARRVRYGRVTSGAWHVDVARREPCRAVRIVKTQAARACRYPLLGPFSAGARLFGRAAGQFEKKLRAL